ncbi:MAG: sel1 repeat family protein, partial [Thiovulaceae bacterium]|nr:sel1 repeat family protein [Sulfurimonadaceae bacterium]
MKKIIVGLFLLISANLYANLVDDGISEAQKGNNKKAVELFTKACEDKQALGCYYAGQAYSKGDVVKKDFTEAFNY